jgi:hypothetical protein
MEPITTIFLLKMLEAALGGYIFAAVLMVALLLFSQVIDWFRSRSHVKMRHANNIAFSLQEKTNAGKYSTIYGIYNTQTETLCEAETVQSNSIDADIASLHKRSKLVVYE